MRVRRGPPSLRSILAPLMLALSLALVALSLTLGTSEAQVPAPPHPAPPLMSLKSVPVPEPANLADFVQDKAAAVQLGKALFWDVQVGSDGVTACATCHFAAGADNRVKNQLGPGLNAGDTTFQLGGPNYTLQPGDFPFTRQANVNDRASAILFDTNDVASSQGVILHDFIDDSDGAADLCRDVADPVFHVGSTPTRRVEPRNAPTTINAVFNFRNFWDGRANNNFNGVNPFGQRDPDARVWKTVNGQLQPVSVVIPLSSLASQAVGPPLSPFEMSCAGRSFAKLGHKMLNPNLRPLDKQNVHANDSVLGALTSAPGDPFLGTGLAVSYADLVKRAFRPEFTDSDQPVVLAGQQFQQLEANFSLFFGLSVQLYEATLVSDDTPVDQFLEGKTAALTALQQEGFAVFNGQGLCVACHSGTEFTNASVANVQNQRLERMHMNDSNIIAVYDNGFYNIGVRPTGDDVGVGGSDPFRNPLSETGFCQQQLLQLQAGKIQPQQVDNLCTTPVEARPDENIAAAPLTANERIGVKGNFKAPGLRNVELTGPYFHNGGKATLRQVVDFYNRGGDFAIQNMDNLDPNIQFLGLTDHQKDALVAFLQALTDERVRFERAPFDHPSICVPNGHIGNTTSVEVDNVTTHPRDDLLCVPAVGAAGGKAPLQPFLSPLPFQQSPVTPLALLGNQAISPHSNQNPSGLAKAFQITANVSGTIDHLYVYLDNGNMTEQIIVGLYFNTPNDNPGTLLTQAMITDPAQGAWKAVAVPPVSVTAGTKYWIALLAPSGAGVLQFRDAASGGRAQSSAHTDLTGLPTSWTPGSSYPNSALSAFAVQSSLP